MAIDAQAIVTFGFYPTISTEFDSRVMTFGWWAGLTGPGPVVGGEGNQLSIKLVGKHKV